LFALVLVCLSHAATSAQDETAIDSSVMALASSPAEVDRFPYPRGDVAIPVPDGYDGATDRYIICEATIDSAGNVDSVQALGCEGEKGILCDRIEAFVPHLVFTPARRRGLAVASRVVFPVLFERDDSSASIGPPVVDDWAEGRCAYTGRVYGDDELLPEDRPQVIERGDAAYPFLARASAQRGEVLLNVIVGPDGVPCFVLCEAVSPVGKGFLEAAVDAAYRYTFRPGLKDGAPQAVWVKIPFRWQP
jgi:hypothetical protein